MYCIKCGSKLDDSDIFCGECGFPVEPLNEPAMPQQTPAVPKKRHPVRFALISIGVVAVLGVTAFVGIHIYKEKRAEAEAQAAAEAEAELRRTLREQMRLGDRYLDELDYERAVAAFEEAIEIDPKNVDAYMGLAQAYAGLQDYQKAIDVLLEGENETDDNELREYREALETIWNVLATLDGMVFVADGDINYSNNVPLSGANVHLERNGDRFKADTVTDSEGYYHFDNLHLGDYDLTITADGYSTLYQHIEIYEMQTEMFNATVEMIPDSMTGDGTASGCIYDALYGFGVEGLTLYIRSGANNLSSDVVATVKTDSNGYYRTPDLPAGLYSVELIDERGYEDKYIDGLINVKILGNQDIGDQNGTVSTELLTGQIRIVLSWGETPSDLDSHLVARLNNGYTYYTGFYLMDAYLSGSEKYAALDLDDTTCYGPETTTIYIQEPGEYRFVVHDFTSYSPRDIAGSGAMVQIYMGNSSMPDYTFYAPQADGYFWEVFTYDGETETITPINHVTSHLDDWYCQIDPELEYYSNVWY